MNIIIPLGGKGERFQKEGYIDPKPLIKVLYKEILFYVIDNLNLKDEDNIFIIYNKYLDKYNFSNIIKIKYPNIHLIKLENDTKGATETIYIGLSEIIKNSIDINIHKKCMLIDGDTFYTESIIDKFRDINENAVFYTKNYCENPVFSYLELNELNNIINIKEKIKISDNANTGVYAFQDINELYKYAKYVLDNNILFNNECYTSCIIDTMIKDKVCFKGIELKNESVNVLGTPSQVNEYIKKKDIK
jgi:dTDP-glucose pyrophosphorylase